VAKKKEPLNPFYPLLVLVGTLFSVTACAYGVMAFTAVRTGPIEAGEAAGQRLLVFLDQYGAALLAAQLVMLGIATVGAIGSDRYWIRRAALRATANGKTRAGEAAASHVEPLNALAGNAAIQHADNSDQPKEVP